MSRRRVNPHLAEARIPRSSLLTASSHRKRFGNRHLAVLRWLGRSAASGPGEPRGGAHRCPVPCLAVHTYRSNQFMLAVANLTKGLPETFQKAYIARTYKTWVMYMPCNHRCAEDVISTWFVPVSSGRDVGHEKRRTEGFLTTG